MHFLETRKEIIVKLFLYLILQKQLQSLTLLPCYCKPVGEISEFNDLILKIVDVENEFDIYFCKRTSI